MKSSRWQDKLLNHFSFIFFAFTLLSAAFAFAGPSRTTYQAKIVKPDGYPLEASSVNFKFTILDPSGSCIIFAETYSGVNMTNTGGLISFSLGAGVKTYPVSSTTFEQIFSNITPNIACDTGGAPAVYTPLASDARKIVMQFHDGGGWQTLPAMNINAVPYAMYANDSQKFNGMIPSEFVQVSTIPTCTASEALRYTGSSFQCVAAGGSATITSGSVVTALGYTPADLTYASSVSSTVFSVSSTVASLSNSVTGISTTVSNLSVSMGAFVSSQWLTSGTTISYNSGNVGIGVSAPIAKLHLAGNSSINIILEGSLNSTGAPGYATRKSRGTIASPTAVLNDDYIGTFGARGYGTTGYSATTKGMIGIKASENWTDAAQGANIVFETTVNSGTTRSEKMRIDHDGNVGVGTSTPITKLDVSGGVRISMEAATCAVSYAGTLRYNSGVVEYCNGTAWAAFGVSGSGILAINGLASGSQTFAVGNSGTLPNISSTGSVHNFNFPNAASAGVTAGLISNTDYSNFNNKVNATSAAVIAALAYTPANQTTVSNLSTSMTTLSASVGALVSSQWVTSGTSVNYLTGNVGVGTATPSRTFSVNGDSQLGNLYVRSVATGSELNFWSSSNLIIGGRREADGSIGNGTIPNVLIAPNGAGARGRLAIGVSTTQTVDAYLHVNGDGSAGIVDAAVFGTTGNGGAGRGTAILFRAPSGSASTSDVARIIGVDSSLTFQTGPGGALNERARFDSTGNMGIGTSSPLSRLDLSANSVTDGATLTFSNLTQSTNVIVRTKDYQNNLGWQIAAAGGSQELFSVRDGTGNTRLFINTTNNTMGVGAASATARLQLTSGSTTIPAFKFTSGNLVTTPQAGAMEYDGNGFYLTDSSGIRRAISSGLSSGTIDNASTINSTGNITMVPVGSVVVSSTTASINSQTGALVVKGGLGVAANIYSSGTIITSSDIQGSSITATSGLITPYVYGSTVSGGVLRLESTTHTTKGNILLAASGGNVGIGTTVPTQGKLQIAQTTDTSSSGLAVVNAAATMGVRLWADGAQGSLDVNAGGTGNLILNRGGGHVGIGTLSPGGVLHVVDNTAADIRLENTGAVSSALRILSQNGINYFESGVSFGAASAADIRFTNMMAATTWMTLQASSGNVGIGTTAPTAKLNLAAGTSSLAPLKLTSGSLLTAPQAGAMEYNGFDLYFTDGGGVRRVLATGTSPSTIDDASFINATGNITMTPVGSVVVSSTTASVNSATGALIVKGGVGVAGDTNIAGTVTAANAIMGLSTGMVGIGASIPVTKLDVRSEGAIKVARIQYSGTGFGTQPNLEMFRSRGTIDAPTATLSNDVIGSVTGIGHNGVSFGAGSTAAIMFRAAQNFSGSNQGSYMHFYTTASGTATQTERMRIDSSGNVGIGTASPSDKLEVAGAIKSSAPDGTFMYMRDAVSGVPTADGVRFVFEDDFFGGNLDALIFEKTDVNNNQPDGGILFANRGMDNIRQPAMVIRGTGAIGIGMTTPINARLSITSGSTTYAPLKFISGSLNTAPQAGAMEFDGTNYYLTDNSGIRRNILWGSSSSPVVTNSTMQAVEFTATSATITPFIYGSTAANGNLRIEATTNASKGVISMGTSGTTFVGIGVSSPLGPLHVVGGINPAFGTDDDDDGIVIQNFQPTLTFKDSTVGDPDDVRLRMNQTALFFETSPDFFVSAPTTTTLMTLTASGRLGIGATSPGAQLEVKGVLGAFGGGGDIYANTENSFIGVDAGTSRFGFVKQYGQQPVLAAANTTPIIFAQYNTSALLGNITSASVMTEQMRISTTGNVGIGTNNPTAALHISNSGTATRGLRIVATASAAGSYAEAQFASDAREYRVGVGSSLETAHNVPGKYYIYDGASNTMRFVVDAIGNVGVGTAAPLARLEVSRLTSLGSQFAVRNNNYSGYLTVPSGGEGIIMSSSRYNGADWISDSTGAAAMTINDGNIQMFTNGGLTAGASHTYTERARIDNAGNFLIGTTNAAHGRLAVESSGTTYLSLNSTNGVNKRTGVFFRSSGTPQFEIGVDGQVNGTRDFYIYDSVSASARVTVNSIGYVGIGTAVPKVPLDVNGIIGTTWGTAFNTSFNGNWNQTTTGYAGLLQFDVATGKFYFWNTPSSAAAGASNPFPVQSMTIDKDGKVGVGTASPGAKFHVNGDARITSIIGGENNGSGNFHLDAWTTGADRGVYLNWGNGTGGAKVGNGSANYGPIAASAFNVSSDRRLKENINPIENPLEKILKIDAVRFTWKDNRRHKQEGERIGLIAQNVENIFPQAVRLDKGENSLPGGTKLVTYSDLVSPIIAAIQEFYKLWISDSKDLHREIASVKEENEKLKSQNTEKEKQLNDIRAYLCAKDPQAPICH